MAQLNRTISYKGIQLSINYTYYPASRGAREHGTGLQLEPDEPESVDIDNVELESELGDLTLYLDLGGLLDGQEDEIEAKLLEELSDDGPEFENY